MGAESSPKIVIVDESPIRAAILEEGSHEAGATDASDEVGAFAGPEFDADHIAAHLAAFKIGRWK